MITIPFSKPPLCRDDADTLPRIKLARGGHPMVDLSPEAIDAYRAGEPLRVLCGRFQVSKNAFLRALKRNGVFTPGGFQTKRAKASSSGPKSRYYRESVAPALREIRQRVRRCLNKKPPVIKRPTPTKDQVLERMRIRAKREYYEKRHNPEWKRKRAENLKAWKIKNPEKLKEGRKRWLEKSDWYQKNKHILVEKRKVWKKANPEKVRLQKKRQRKTPAGRIRQTLKKRIKELCGNPRQFSQTIGCSGKHLVEHLERQFTGKMSWKNYGKWHIDHIIPCAKFDHTDRRQVLVCWNWQNLRPLWARANIKKAASVPLPQMHMPLSFTS